MAACMQPIDRGDLANQCVSELAAEGTYRWNPADAVPTVTPGEDGTQAVADNINACIRAKAGA
jgi:hypothetical protein